MVALRDEFLRVYETRQCRLTEVLREFILYKAASQQELASFAVDWTIASLAHSPRCSVIESLFYVSVDLMYFSTDHAAKHFNESAGRRLYGETIRKYEELIPAFREIMFACVQSLANCSMEGSRQTPLRSIPGPLGILTTLRFNCVEHAKPYELRNLILVCVPICHCAKNDRLGGSAFKDIDKWILALSNVAASIFRSLEELVRAGKLVERNGKIVRPTGE
jgi:hypothetical protein